MRLVSLDVCTRVLAVAMLVASAFSAGLRHAHPGGDLAHDHHAARMAPPANAPRQAAADLFLDAAQSHVHVYLLGFEFTVPTENDADGESNDGSPSGADSFVTRLVGDDFDASSRAIVASRLGAPDAGRLLAPPVVISSKSAMSATAVPITPLCDSARRVRTGVLRI